MPTGIPTTCLYSLVPNRIKCPTKTSAHHIHFDKTIHDIFLGFSEVKCISVITCKARRAFSLEGSFNKINMFIFKLNYEVK